MEISNRVQLEMSEVLQKWEHKFSDDDDLAKLINDSKRRKRHLLHQKYLKYLYCLKKINEKDSQMYEKMIEELTKDIDYIAIDWNDIDECLLKDTFQNNENLSSGNREVILQWLKKPGHEIFSKVTDDILHTLHQTKSDHRNALNVLQAVHSFITRFYKVDVSADSLTLAVKTFANADLEAFIQKSVNALGLSTRDVQTLKKRFTRSTFQNLLQHITQQCNYCLTQYNVTYRQAHDFIWDLVTECPDYVNKEESDLLAKATELLVKNVEYAMDLLWSCESKKEFYYSTDNMNYVMFDIADDSADLVISVGRIWNEGIPTVRDIIGTMTTKAVKTVSQMYKDIRSSAKGKCLLFNKGITVYKISYNIDLKEFLRENVIRRGKIYMKSLDAIVHHVAKHADPPKDISKIPKKINNKVEEYFNMVSQLIREADRVYFQYDYYGNLQIIFKKEKQVAILQCVPNGVILITAYKEK